jgi:predicted amidophosphoribosyltransferase
MRPGRGAARSAQPEYTQAALNAKKYEAPTFMRARAALRVFSLNSTHVGLQQKKRRPNIHAVWLCGRCAAQPESRGRPSNAKKI